MVEAGYEFFAHRQLVTIFSAPNYCGEFDNAGKQASNAAVLPCHSPTMTTSMLLLMVVAIMLLMMVALLLLLLLVGGLVVDCRGDGGDGVTLQVP